MGHTRRPCPGCGQVDPARPADGVCGSCARLLREAREHREAVAADKDLVPHHTGLAWHDVPPMGYSSVIGEFADGLAKAMYALIQSVSQPHVRSAGWPHEDGRILRGPGSSYRSSLKWRLFRPATVDAIRLLHEQIKGAIEEAFRAGKRKGADLLGQLADGELTVDDFGCPTGQFALFNQSRRK